MKIVAFAEQRESKFKKIAFECTVAAAGLAKQLGAETAAIVVGKDVMQNAAELGGYGAEEVYVAEDERLNFYSATAYSKVVKDIVSSLDADIILFPASAMGKDVAASVAAKIGAGIAADCVALSVRDGEVIATRPVYAGKALIDLKVNSRKKIFTLRPNVFSQGTPGAVAAKVEKVEVVLQDSDFTSKVTSVSISKAGRPDLTEADIIVSGGRGLGGPEHFKMIEEVADALGAAVGASRAVVDAGWRPHSDQVGQTGKTVSPTLYIAVAISGAIQHLAGMSSSRYIVAVNKDKDAPIFQIADFGIVGDAFEIVPEMNIQLRKALGKD